MRADIEKDIFIKMEYASNKVMLIAATPVKIEKEIYVVEIIKDISLNNNMISNIQIKIMKEFFMYKYTIGVS